MYLYRATKDPYLLEVAVDILESIEHSTRTSCGYATVRFMFQRSTFNNISAFINGYTDPFIMEFSKLMMSLRYLFENYIWYWRYTPTELDIPYSTWPQFILLN